MYSVVRKIPMENLKWGEIEKFEFLLETASVLSIKDE